jgi:hypothetical protein
LPALLGDTLRKFLDDEIPQELYTTMDSIASEYAASKSKEQLTSIYTALFNDRLEIFHKSLESMAPKPQANPDAVVPLTEQLLNN